MGGFLQDLRYGWRSFTRAPGFALVVVGTLALGIGSTTLIFSLVNTFALKPLPYIQEKGLMHVFATYPRQQFDEMEMSFPDFNDIRERARSFERLAAWAESQAYLTLDREPERFSACYISPGLFEVIGVKPMLGREFLPEEETDGNQWATIIISHRIWKERLGGDPAVLGRTLKMNGRVRTIVGVAPEHVRFPETADFYIPLGYKPSEDTRGASYLDVVGRLKSGATKQQASAEVAGIMKDNAQRYPDTNEGRGGRAAPFRDQFLNEMRPILTLLMAAVGFVLLIACANVANLMLARGAGRTREIGLRVALGATRWRIVRQMLTEGLLLALMGGVIGVVLAYWSMDLLLATIPQELPFWMEFKTDQRVLAFTFGVSALAAVLFGLAPALQVSSVSPHDALKDGGAQGAGGRRRNRMRSALVVAEISLALVLLAGAGLMIRSLLHQQAERLKIDTKGLVTGNVTLPIAVYKTQDERRVFFDALFPAIEALPGVQSVSATQVLPLGNDSWRNSIVREGKAEDLKAGPHTFVGIVRPNYFKTMGIRMVRGRDFDAQDGPGRPKVAIVSETAARKLWPNEDPIGKRFKENAHDTTAWCSVVGVVGDLRQRVSGREDPAQIYYPHMQNTVQTLTLVVRSQTETAAMVTALRRLIQSRDPDLPFYEVKTMEEAAHQGLWEERLYVYLMSVFATIALLIAGVGIYGVMAYSVSQRTQEIGIRMALGAARDDVVRMVVGQATRLTLIGLAIGLGAAFAVTRLMASLLFGVQPGDPPTFIVVSVLLALSGIIAAWIPALRATRIDPMTALRAE